MVSYLGRYKIVPHLWNLFISPLISCKSNNCFWVYLFTNPLSSSLKIDNGYWDLCFAMTKIKEFVCRSCGAQLLVVGCLLIDLTKLVVKSCTQIYGIDYFEHSLLSLFSIHFFLLNVSDRYQNIFFSVDNLSEEVHTEEPTSNSFNMVWNVLKQSLKLVLSEENLII